MGLLSRIRSDAELATRALDGLGGAVERVQGLADDAPELVITGRGSFQPPASPLLGPNGAPLVPGGSGFGSNNASRGGGRGGGGDNVVVRAHEVEDPVLRAWDTNTQSIVTTLSMAGQFCRLIEVPMFGGKTGRYYQCPWGNFWPPSGAGVTSSRSSSSEAVETVSGGNANDQRQYAQGLQKPVFYSTFAPGPQSSKGSSTAGAASVSADGKAIVGAINGLRRDIDRTFKGDGGAGLRFAGGL